jgi:hypothetical protein
MKAYDLEWRDYLESISDPLDIFVKDFVKILEKYSDYLVVGGFASISTGRAIHFKLLFWED